MSYLFFLLVLFLLSLSKKNISMIKFTDLKQGDYVLAESDGQAWEGEVTDFN